MKFFAAVAAFLATSVVAAPAPVEKRAVSGPQPLIDAFNVLASKVVVLNNSVNAFNPTGPSAIPQLLTIQQNVAAVSDSIKNATKVANNNAPLDSPDSLQVGLAVFNFAPQVFSLLDNLKRNKVPKFDNLYKIYSVRKTVLTSLQDQQAQSVTLGQAVKAKISSDYQDLADQINSAIKDNFDQAIKVYSVKSNKIELPNIPSSLPF